MLPCWFFGRVGLARLGTSSEFRVWSARFQATRCWVEDYRVEDVKGNDLQSPGTPSKAKIPVAPNPCKENSLEYVVHILRTETGLSSP